MQVMGKFATRGASVLAILATHFNVHICVTEHVLAEFNVPCDTLSRDGSVKDVLGAEAIIFCDDKLTDQLINTAINLCNPMVGREELPDEFDAFWGRVVPFVDSIILDLPSSTPSTC